MKNNNRNKQTRQIGQIQVDITYKDAINTHLICQHGVWNRHYFIEEIKAYKFLILDDILVVNLDNTKTESFAIFLIIFGASLFKRFYYFVEPKIQKYMLHS